MSALLLKIEMWDSICTEILGESRNEGFPSLKKLSLTAVPFFEWEKVLLFEHPLSMNIVQIIVRDFDFWSLCRVKSLALSIAALTGRPDSQ